MYVYLSILTIFESPFPILDDSIAVWLYKRSQTSSHALQFSLMQNAKAEVGFPRSRVTSLIPRKVNPNPRSQAIERTPVHQIEFFRGLEISGKIFSRRYELSRGFEQGI